MLLFKAAGSTYPRVVKQALHAFPLSPAEVRRHEFILLSKNREACSPTEAQIQYVAKLLAVRPATPEELESAFAGVSVGKPWRFFAKLYWSRPLDRPFNLSQVAGLNYRRCDTVQEFARIDEADEVLLFRHLARTNTRLILDVINNAEPPKNDE